MNITIYYYKNVLINLQLVFMIMHFELRRCNKTRFGKSYNRNGANAAGLVGLDYESENADATVLGHKTEGSAVKDPLSSYEIAKSRLVPVRPR